MIPQSQFIMRRPCPPCSACSNGRRPCRGDGQAGQHLRRHGRRPAMPSRAARSRAAAFFRGAGTAARAKVGDRRFEGRWNRSGRRLGWRAKTPKTPSSPTRPFWRRSSTTGRPARDSGWRRRLASTGVSSPRSPARSTQHRLPARHLATIFSVCHFSPAEQDRFLDAYQAAHPGKLPDLGASEKLRHISLMVPDFGNEQEEPPAGGGHCRSRPEDRRDLRGHRLMASATVFELGAANFGMACCAVL